LDSFETIQQKLKLLGADKLQEGSLEYAEFLTYAAVLDEVYARIDELEKEAFVCTGADFGLDMFESAVGAMRKDLPIEERREMLIRRLSMTANDFTKLGMINSLVGLGLKTEIEEDTREEKIKIKCKKVLDPSRTNMQYVEVAAEALPAHIEFAFEF
jgi:hypothetical protein